MSSTNDPHLMLERAYQLIRSGDKEQAKQLVAALVQQMPDNPDVLYLAAYFTDKTDEKIRLLEQLLAIKPDHLQARLIMAKVRAPAAQEAQAIHATQASPPRPYAFDLDAV